MGLTFIDTVSNFCVDVAAFFDTNVVALIFPCDTEFVFSYALVGAVAAKLVIR